MTDRQIFTMSDEDLELLLETSRQYQRTPVMKIGNYSTLDTANQMIESAWRRLGDKMGFIGSTARSTGPDPKRFSAIPKPKPKDISAWPFPSRPSTEEDPSPTLYGLPETRDDSPAPAPPPPADPPPAYSSGGGGDYGGGGSSGSWSSDSGSSSSDSGSSDSGGGGGGSD